MVEYFTLQTSIFFYIDCFFYFDSNIYTLTEIGTFEQKDFPAIVGCYSSNFNNNIQW